MIDATRTLGLFHVFNITVNVIINRPVTIITLSTSSYLSTYRMICGHDLHHFSLTSILPKFPPTIIRLGMKSILYISLVLGFYFICFFY